MSKNRQPEQRSAAPQGEGKSDAGEPKFRLRPQRPRTNRQGDIAWSVALKTVYRYARSSGQGRNSGGTPSVRAGSRAFDQRCAVRVTYSPNRTAGQWRAHGIYVARESATQDASHAGFGDAGHSVDVADTLRGWQEADDVRLWKVIISPEFGDRLDLERLTRDIVKQAERDLGTPLKWVAVTHFNTEHPHVHLVVRGRRDDGSDLALPRSFVQHGLRQAAGKACTTQLGPRTQLDALAAEEREVSEHRYTSIDRAIERLDMGGDSRFLHLRCAALPADGHQQNVASRLAALQAMGLAEPIRPNEWRIRRDFQTVLQAMQKATDRQKMLAANGNLLSDQRLRMVVTNIRRVRELQGRVLVHGQEEPGDRRYMLLEGTDAQVHFLYYTPEMEQARSSGKLRSNSFVRLRRQFVNGQPVLEVDDRGDANMVLKNKGLLSDAAKHSVERGLQPTDEGWAGWLGAYQRAVREAAAAKAPEQATAEPTGKRALRTAVER